ncbi:MAG: chorismate-binding protein, partial [Gammaproteobacteria bacterium]|nr:chorismate-binding protein [Gammaproteobacteria bacterium]
MSIILIDNYDSFTFNLSQQIERLSGITPMVFKNDEISVEAVKKIDPLALVISPGPGRPDRAHDVGIAPHLLQELDVPVLGVCLGYQLMAHLCGAKIALAIEAMHGRLSAVSHLQDPLFENIPSTFNVVRYHSLIVENNLPSELQALATTDSGELMAVKHRSKPWWGVQFHPESISTEWGDELIANFLRLAKIDLHPAKPIARTTSRSVANKNLVFEKLVLPEKVATPANTLKRLHQHLFGKEENQFILGSPTFIDMGQSQFVYMGSSNKRIDYVLKDNTITITGRDKISIKQDIFTYMDSLLKEKNTESILPFPFTGGLVGYFGYELKALCGGDQAHQSPYPDASFLWVEEFIVLDRSEQVLYCVSTDEERLLKLVDNIQTFFDCATRKDETPQTGTHRIYKPFFDRDKKQYLKDILICQDKIREGESYEVCLTNQIRLDLVSNPADLYWQLCDTNPAPYASFYKTNTLSVVSSSPEKFLTIHSDGRVRSKPIKGTRAVSLSQDLSIQQDNLKKSIKDRAENLMIVDLVRNDLNRVCETGSVNVSKLMDVESFRTVHQMVSTVCGQRRADKSNMDVIRACFPGGSMTGAPKIRTMQIIDELEGQARGIYSGALGFLSFNGEVDL